MSLDMLSGNAANAHHNLFHTITFQINTINSNLQIPLYFLVLHAERQRCKRSS